MESSFTKKDMVKGRDFNYTLNCKVLLKIKAKAKAKAEV
jgi:hypothetical protein